MRNCHLRRRGMMRRGEESPAGLLVCKKWEREEIEGAKGNPRVAARGEERRGEKGAVEGRGMPMPPLCTLQGCCNLPYLVGGLQPRE